MDFIQLYFGTDIKTILFIVVNLVIIESLLSVDNAAALAMMVKDLPHSQRGKALKYGIFGAYFFRGLCLVFSSFLIKITWVKALGGFYLMWIAINHFISKKDQDENALAGVEAEKGFLERMKDGLYNKTLGLVGSFWATVILVEIMDLSFSIDNIFAAVAFTDKIGLICLGVFIGILAMRFVAQKFVDLMEKYPKLETAAFVVLLLLGLKLIVSYVSDFNPKGLLYKIINSHEADVAFSLVTLIVFLFPILMNIKWGKISSRAEKTK
jgi:YkoY family integral membrane protein